jgi:endonuclease/exonuclease/phosphatase family metal-dependent hydrolase
MLMAAMFGGGWFYFGGKMPDLGSLSRGMGGFGQQSAPQAGYYPQQQPPASNPAGSSYSSDTSTSRYPAQYASQSNSAAVNRPLQGGPTIRIASYNIQVFGDSKADKPYIMQTLAAIVRNFHIVAIQEIRTKDQYLLDRFLRDYVNTGGRRYDYVIGPRLGRSNSKEQYAFLFDTAAVEVNRNGIYTVHDPEDLLHREPMVAMFRTRGPPPQEAFTFVLVNIHTDPDETNEELDALGQVYRAVRQAARGEDDIIVLGDLNVDDRHLGQLGQIPGVRPIVTGVFTNTRQNKLYDNIVVHAPSSAEFTGRWGVYDVQRLHNLTMDQALQVSDHLPVWAEFSVYESAAPGRVANREGAAASAQ